MYNQTDIIYQLIRLKQRANDVLEAFRSEHLADPEGLDAAIAITRSVISILSCRRLLSSPHDLQTKQWVMILLHHMRTITSRAEELLATEIERQALQNRFMTGIKPED